MAGKIEEKLQEQTATTAFQLVWGAIKGLSGLVLDENAVQRGMKEYARKFLERYGNVKVLNMDQPVPLSDIYVAAQALSPRSLQSFSSVEELHKTFLERGQRRLAHLAHLEEGRRDCLELANEQQLLNVLGAPGAGKSTFLRRLGLEALRPRRTWNDSLRRSTGLRAGLEDRECSRYNHDCLPILIELRRFRTDEIDLMQLIRNELATCGLPESENLAKALLSGGRLLILLDGVDEVPSDRLDKAITHMRDFVDQHGKNRFVISCRTAFYKGYFARFRDVLLADFDDEQIANFVRNWFRSEQDRQRGVAEEFLSILGEPTNASAKELASTPLLLTFLCLTYDDRQRLPPNRSELYRQALEILMERWAASKRVHNEPIYRELHARLEVQMLAEIAAPAFRDNRYFFTRRELTDRITEFLRNELNAPKHLDGDQVLNAIEVQQGLIVQRAQDAWSFSHLTLQEYLTAVWHSGNQKINELAQKQVLDVRWREVFILLSGAVDKADDLLRRMLKAAEQQLITEPRAAQVLRWASSRVSAAQTTEQAIAGRALAFSLARDLASIHALDRAINRTRSLALSGDRDLAADRDLALAHDLALDRDLALDHARNLTHVRKRLISFIDTDHLTALVQALDPSVANALEHTKNLYSTLELFIARCRALDRAGVRTRELARDFQLLDTYVENLLLLFPERTSSQILSGDWHAAKQQVQAVRNHLGKDASFEDVLRTWKRILDIFIHALVLPPDLLITEMNEDVLDEYFYACELIITCKNAATRISRPAWDDICQRMLNPPEQSPGTGQRGRRKTRRV